MLEKFSHIDLSGKGHITLDEFSRYLQVPVSDSLKEVYDMYDRVGYNLSRGVRKTVFGVSDQSDTNCPIHPQKKARILKTWI